MRITADLRMYRHSGIGRYLRNIIPLLLPRLQAGHIRVLGTQELFAEAPWLSDPRVELFHTTAPIYSIAEQRLAFSAAYRATDLLWVPHYNAPLSYPGKLAVTIHDIAPIALPGVQPSAIKRAYARVLISRSVAQASAVLCDSAFTQKELFRVLHTDAARTSVIPLALDTEWPTSVPPHIEPDASPYLLYVGNIKPNKNLTLLLTAFASLLDRVPYRLLLAGRIRGFGTEDDAAIRQAETLGDRVRFTGEITDLELQCLYAGATALVLPSLYEGFGLPVLEAMQLGCPVLSSSASSLPEVGGPAALYFDPRSTTELSHRLLQTLNPAVMADLRTRGFAQVKTFSFDRCATATAEILNNAISSGGVP